MVKSSYFCCQILQMYYIIHVFSHFKNEDVKFLLAEGMIVMASQTKDGTILVECAAPILRNMMLSSIHGPNFKFSGSPTNANILEPKWLLARTIEVYGCSMLFIVSNEKVCIYFLRS